MTPTRTFTFAQGRDLSEIKSLLQASQLPDEDLTPVHLPHFLIWRPDQVDQPGHSDQHNQAIAGVVGLEILDQYALLRSLAVTPVHQRQGLASQLTQTIEDYASSQQIKAIYLLTTTASAFFSKRGYQTINRDTVPPVMQTTTEFRSLCPDSAICMTKRLR